MDPFSITVAIHHRTLPETDSAAAFVVALVVLLTATISKPDEHAMVGRLLVGLRICAAVQAAIMLWTAGRLALTDRAAGTGSITALLLISLLGALYVTFVWLCTGRKANPVAVSPWEQAPRLNRRYSQIPSYTSFEEARERLGFSRPATKVESAEGDHYCHDGHTHWTKDVDQRFRTLLATPLRS